MKHVHAELMKQYAEDAMTTDKPWELWEINTGSGPISLSDHPAWSINGKYRRKPKTININGLEVPEPYRGEMEIGQSYYHPNFENEDIANSYVWNDDTVDVRIRDRGLLHLTEEAAELHGRALASFTEVG